MGRIWRKQGIPFAQSGPIATKKNWFKIQSNKGGQNWNWDEEVMSLQTLNLSTPRVFMISFEKSLEFVNGFETKWNMSLWQNWTVKTVLWHEVLSVSRYENEIVVGNPKRREEPYTKNSIYITRAPLLFALPVTIDILWYISIYKWHVWYAIKDKFILGLRPVGRLTGFGFNPTYNLALILLSDLK